MSAQPQRRMAKRNHWQTGQRLTAVETPTGLPPVERIGEVFGELAYMVRVLKANEESPIDTQHGYLALQEVADAFYARGKEIEMLIFSGEMTPVPPNTPFCPPEGGTVEKGPYIIPKGSPYYRLRTGSLTSFLDLAKSKKDLGSRRVAEQEVLVRQRYDAGDAGRWG